MADKQQKQKPKPDMVGMLKGIIRAEVKNSIKAEVKRILRPLLKEYAKQEINAVLAEHFLGTVAKAKSGGRSLVETFAAPSEQEKKEEARQRQIESEMRRRELKNKLLESVGADKDETMQMIFEDVEYEGMADPISGDFGGAYVDTDDEGADLSLLGIK